MPHRNGNKGHQQQGHRAEERGTRAEERYVEERDSGFGGQRPYEPRYTGGRERWQHGSQWREDEERGGYREGRPMYGPEDRGPSYQGETGGGPRYQGGGTGRGEHGFGRFRDEGSYGARDYGDEDARGQGFYGQGRAGYDLGSRTGQGEGTFGSGRSPQTPVSRGRHYGKAPQGYTRSDDRIRDEVCDLLMQGHVDPSQITVRVQNGEVTLEGRVEDRREKYQVEELAEGVLGVKDVDNRLRVGSRSQREEGTSNEERERSRASETSRTSRGTSA
jgi:osmotically-inducible protein OsmY